MEGPVELTGEESAVLIAGPTASGKSALALALAAAAARRGLRPLVVNADSMQVYDALRVLSARPGPAEEAQAEHRLYGHVPAERRYSVGAWFADARSVLAEARAEGRLPIVVGGTGLYFRALTEGLAETPEIPDEVRRYWLVRAADLGGPGLHAALAERDPESAAALRPGDRQRLLRALEVLDATGLPLREWQRRRGPAPLVDRACARLVVVEPGRETLHRRIEARFDRMVEEGAVAEAEALLSLGLDPSLPAMKAIGVREFGAFLSGEVTLEEAVRRAKTGTRRYAKRQATWLRHQMADWPRVGGAF